MKKFISLLMAVVIVAVMTISAAAEYTVWHNEIDDPRYAEKLISSEQALANYTANTGITVPTYRYYFLMPNGSNGMRNAAGECAKSWFNQYTQGAGVYWWGSAPAAATGWAGYQAMVEDAEQCIYYVDMPRRVVAFDWNNGIDGTMDEDFPLYESAAQTVDVACEFPEPGEYLTMPEGADNFDHCIFIIDPDEVSENPMSHKLTCGGTWYFYYDNGCYGEYAQTSSNFKSIDENCCNPDHFDASGNHVGHSSGPAVVRGDYNGDGELAITDATRVQRILAGLNDMPSQAQIIALDAYQDGELAITDATRIQRVLAGICDIDGNKLS